MLPPITGGLHCGKLGETYKEVMAAGAPADNRRAPLRRHEVAQDDQDDDVLPPITGGLHCGVGDRDRQASDRDDAPDALLLEVPRREGRAAAASVMTDAKCHPLVACCNLTEPAAKEA